jgi:succinate dehydrogenase/fumarate reductase flavoprotein subunit
MTERPRLARRNFLKNTAAAGAAVAATSLLGTTPSQAAGVPRKWDKETDVVIIGSGIAGMCAAIEAADAGAKVIVLEKDAQPGGAAKFSGGHMTAAGTDVQKRAGIEDKSDWLFDAMMETSEMTAVPELVRKFAESSGEHIRWLENLGVKFTDFFMNGTADRIKDGVGRGHQIAQSPDYPGGPHRGGLGVMVVLMRSADKRGVTTLLNHKMTRLIRVDGGGTVDGPAVGPVVGIEAETDGKPLTIKANRGVVLTTGGWSGNLEMGLAEDPRLTPDIYPDCWPYHLCLGEGHLAAVDVGAELSNMSFGGYLPMRWGSRVYQIWEPQTFTSVPSINTGVNIVDFRRVIIVKSDGKRYINEMLGDMPMSPSAYPRISTSTPGDFPGHPFNEAYLNLKERPRNVWAVTDAEGAAALGWLLHPEQVRNPNPNSGIALYPEMVAFSDNLKDLAAKMKVDPTGFETTVTRYNKFVDAGKDEDFSKPEPAYQIAQGPFYAMKLALIKHTRRNGIRVNTRGQVLDRSGLAAAKNPASGKVSIDDEKFISRLYAAGECANYLGRYHSHGTLGIYGFYGRVAGKSAASEKSLA